MGASYYIDGSKCVTCNDSLVINPLHIWSFLPEKTLSFSFWGIVVLISQSLSMLLVKGGRIVVETA